MVGENASFVSMGDGDDDIPFLVVLLDLKVRDSTSCFNYSIAGKPTTIANH